MGSAGVYLITGPSAAGKSTVARQLAARFMRGVHVEGDVFRRSIVTGREEMTPEAASAAHAQLRLRYRLAAAVADGYAAEGFTVVLEDVVAGDLLAEVVELVRTRPLHVVVLVPSLETLSVRNATRVSNGYERWSVEELRRAFVEDTPRLGLWLDTSHETPEQTVDAILARSEAV